MLVDTGDRWVTFMGIIDYYIKQSYEDQKKVLDVYDEVSIKKCFCIPKEYQIEVNKEFGISVDREGLQFCDSKLYSYDNFEIVESESQGFCSDYDFWFMIFDMALYPQFMTVSQKSILGCSYHYNRVYIGQLFKYTAYNYHNNNLINLLPYSYRYYQIRIRYLLHMSNYKIKNEVIFIPVRTKCPNATAIVSKDNIPAIKIGVGLEYILDRLTRFVEYAEVQVDDYLNIVFENLKIQIVLIALFFYGRITSTQVLGVFIIENSKMEKCRNRRIEQMDFILCHEMGHIYYNNIKDESTRQIELQSDVFALNVLMSNPDKENIYQRRNKNQIIGSVLILFKEMSLVEKLYDRICDVMKWEKPNMKKEHPSYEERYANILKSFGDIEKVDKEDQRTIFYLQKLDVLFANWPNDILEQYVKAQLDIDSNSIKKVVKETIENVL